MKIAESAWNDIRNVLSDKISAFYESSANRTLAVGYQESINAAYRTIREELEQRLRPGAA